jgi:predicted nuclease of restriction endonuclease-like (RecB) superfamily
MTQESITNYTNAIQQIKAAILQSRYRAAKLVNREMLSLYYGIGKYVSENSRHHYWGTNAIEIISGRLQQELPGLRGFSASNIKYMRQFYEAWNILLSNRQPTAGDLTPFNNAVDIGLLLLNCQPMAGNLIEQDMEYFLNVGFTHHIEILAKTKSIDERLFYIERCATEFWSKEQLKHHLKGDLFHKQGTMPNNFARAITDADLCQRAIRSFKDEYLLDYINIEDDNDDAPNERVLEREIVHNIKNFIMSLGKDFSFIGNQYRLTVNDKEYFIDLLFFNRQLQCLVAIELKRGEFLPEYVGKMNFYLSALDDLVRLPHENNSIGIILCKEQQRSTVEYAFRDFAKPMGAATYKTANKLPEKYKHILPSPERLQELL